MGGDTIKPEQTGAQIKDLAKYLPQYLQSVGNNIGPYEQSLVNARATTDPQNLALNQSLLQYFGPQFSQIGSDIQGQEAQNTARNELGVINGAGGQLARAGQSLNKEIDPEYYNLRALGADKLTQLLQGQDPNRLTGAEMANTERGLNRTNRVNGLSEVPASTSAINNAMTFGSALDTKRNTLLNSINALPQNLAAMKSGTDSFMVATGRPQYGANTGNAQYGTSQQGFGSSVQGMAQGLFGQIGQNTNQTQSLVANKRDTLDRVNGTMSSMPSC